MTVNAAAGTATNLSADEIDGKDSAQFLAANGKAADLLDGQDSSAFAGAGHNHDGRYHASGSTVADSDRLDGYDSSAFMRDDLTIEVAQLAYTSDYHTRSVTAECPGDKRATGGGGQVEGGIGANIALTQSWTSGRGWSVTAKEMSPYAGEWSLAAFAVCTSVSP